MIKKRIISQGEGIPGLVLRMKPYEQLVLEDGTVITNYKPRNIKIVINTRNTNLVEYTEDDNWTDDAQDESHDVDGNTSDVESEDDIDGNKEAA